MSNKDAAEMFVVPKNTISTWVKSKDKLLEALQETSSQTKKLRGCNYEDVDKAVYEWFTLQRSQHVPIDGAILKEKELFYAEKLKFPELKAADGWMEKWKKRYEKITRLFLCLQTFTTNTAVVQQYVVIAY